MNVTKQEGCIYSAAFFIISAYTFLKPFKITLLNHVASLSTLAVGQTFTFIILFITIAFLVKKPSAKASAKQLALFLNFSALISMLGAFFISHLLSYLSTSIIITSWVLYGALEVILF